MTLEPFTYEVVRDSIYYICEEMMTELRKICISQLVREAKDCACTITDASGRLIAQSTGTPGHYNSIPTAVKGTLRKIPPESLREGDVLLTNDPWICAGHLPDVVVMTPIFFEGRLLAFAATLAHQLDMGGMSAGSSTANTTDHFQEGLQLPPLKVVEEGRLNTPVLDIIQQNVRVPDVVTHDLQCEFAVNTRGSARLINLCRKHGAGAILEFFDTSIRRSEALVREEIERIPDGSWSWTDHVDDDGQSDVPVQVSARVTVQGSDLYVDFSGSAAQTAGGINMTPSFRNSYVNLAVRCYLDASIPNNEGCFLPIHVSAPAGTIVNPIRPAAVGGRTSLISRVADVVMACMAQALPHKAVAGYGGCNAQPFLYGTHPATGRYFIYADSNWGGLGARHGKDGVDCLAFPQNVGNYPIEVLEAFYPVVVERYRFRPDSEGAGTYRGGFGSIKDYRLLSEMRLLIPGDRTKLPPFGLMGGGDAVLTEYVRLRDGVEEKLRTKREHPLMAGDVFSLRTPGGGGLYDPLKRDPAAVGRDVALEYISPEHALIAYGVVVDREGRVDEGRTREVRKERAARSEL